MDEFTKNEYNKRYQSMMESDLGMTTKDFQNFDVINFESDSIYHVEMRSKIKVKCDCPDFAKRGYNIGVPCKHILFVLKNYEDYKTKGEVIYNSILDRFKNNLKEVV